MNTRIKNKKLLIIPFVLAVSLSLAYYSFIAYSYISNGQTFNAGATYSYIDIGGLTPTQAKQSIDNLISSKNVTIVTEPVTIVTNAHDLGIEANESALVESQNSIRLKSAFLPFIYKANVSNLLTLNPVTFKNTVQSGLKTEHNPAMNSSFTIKNKEIAVESSQDGNGIEPESIEAELFTKLDENNNDISINTELSNVSPAINQDALNALKPDAETIFSNSYVLTANGKEYELDKTTIIKKLITNPSGTQLLLSKQDAVDIVKTAAIDVQQQKVDEVTTVYKSGKATAITTNGQNGTKVNNVDELSKKLVEQLEAKQAYKQEVSFDEVTFDKKEVVVDDTKKSVTYTYTITTWGTTKSNLEDFATKVAQTLADGRGWAQAGVTFKRVSSGGNFDIVLSEPAELPARYPGTCDSTYSCRVGRYVIINDDRWRGATPSWNNAGGSLRNYQHMVVNHEVGHRLGRGHEYCAAPGQAAPVMQQQSISLQGCNFNPWPLTYEINTVQNSL